MHEFEKGKLILRKTYGWKNKKAYHFFFRHWPVLCLIDIVKERSKCSLDAESLSNSLVYCILVYLSRPIDQETAKWSFRSSSQAATCYYMSNYSKVGAIPFKCFVQGHNKRTCWPISTLTVLNAERHAGKM